MQVVAVATGFQLSMIGGIGPAQFFERSHRILAGFKGHFWSGIAVKKWELNVSLAHLLKTCPG
jgi:hypothetical protein